MGDRLALTEFWEKRSHEPTVETMMLNVLAQSVDLQDKQDVLDALPDYEGMRIIELGAGIGRITPILAFKAKHVTAVDIVESFVEANRKNNEHMGNITFHTCEASAMKVPSNSIDLVFTNWLLMYLTDAEVVELMKSTLNWLSIGGYFHIRESCSEPSKRNLTTSPGGSLQTDTNPTHYRQVCQYLSLLETIGIYDEVQNIGYKFEVLWSKSVNTYVEVYGNWRQNQILVKKITYQPTPRINGFHAERKLASKTTVEDWTTLLKIIKNESINEQATSDKFSESKDQISKPRNPVARFLLETADALQKSPRWILNVTSSDKLDICPFDLAKIFDARVADLESSIYAYNWKLAKATTKQDKRVRLYWANMHSTCKNQQDWSFVNRQFDAVFFSCPSHFGGQWVALLSAAKKMLTPEGRIFIVDESEGEQHITKTLSEATCQIISIKDITKEFQQELKQRTEATTEKSRQLLSYYRSLLNNDKLWFVVEAK